MRIVLISFSIASFLTPFMGSSINIALPTIAKEFELDAISLNWVATAFILSAAIFLAPFGRAADLREEKSLYNRYTSVYNFIYSMHALFFRKQSDTLQVFFRESVPRWSSAIAIITSVFPLRKEEKHWE